MQFYVLLIAMDYFHYNTIQTRTSMKMAEQF